MIIYTRQDGGLSVVHPAPIEQLKEVLGFLTNAELEQHIWERSVPEDAINPRYIEDDDIPESREFRDAWCDVTLDAKIDIDCAKARDIVLEKVRANRVEKFRELDEQFIIAQEKGQDTSKIIAEKQKIRDITDPIKALDVTGKINDELILNELRRLSIF